VDPETSYGIYRALSRRSGGCFVASASDPYNLQRFLDAQTPLIERVFLELNEGKKQSHWMWFVFPQIKGLGYSSTSIEFAISSRREAEAYLEHLILGSRLRQCTQLVNEIVDRSIDEIFGYPDDMKFQSSMTLFAACAPEEKVFHTALWKYFGGKVDQRTIELMSSPGCG
jgi:uncharacterized protein (DUF1810 family)